MAGLRPAASARGNLFVFVDRFAGGIDDIVRGSVDAGLVELRPPRDLART
jgi:hypothetical protein